MRHKSESEGSDKISKRRVDPLIWLIPLIMSSLSILMVTSSSSPASYLTSGTPFRTGLMQIVWLICGICAMCASYLTPISFWRRVSGSFFVISLLVVVSTLLIGTSVGGARRWIRIASLSVQPSEILTFALVFIAARCAEEKRDGSRKCFARYMIFIFLSAIPLMLQPDLGSTMLVAMICMGMYCERFDWKGPLKACALLVAVVVLLILIEPYRMRRVFAFLDPWADPMNTGYQTVQALIASANGGIWGAGLGYGFHKLNYLPAAYTDFIYVAIAEELGLIGTLGVLLLSLFWVFRVRALYNRVDEGFPTSVVWGMTLSVVLPLCINIAGVTNLLPLTGMPLPFLSYGGSSLIMAWARVGVLMRAQYETTLSAQA